MKKLLCFAFVLMLTLAPAMGERLIPLKSLSLAPVCEPEGEVTICVAPGGTGDGSADAPMGSFTDALEKAKELIPSASVIISMADGEYMIDETVVLNTEYTDGVNGHTLTVMGSGNTVLTGGVAVSGWKDEGDGLWSAPLSGLPYVTGVYADGRNLTLARQQVYGGYYEPNGKKGIVNLYGDRAATWADYDPYTDVVSVTFTTRGAYDLDVEALAQDVPQLAFLHTQTFMMQKFGIATLTGDEESITFTLDEDSINLIKYARMQDFDTSRDLYYLMNSRQFLDEEGEYWYDKEGGRLWICSEADPSEKEIRVPVTEGLIQVKGKRSALAVGLRFENLTFACSAYKLYSDRAFKEDQSDSIVVAYREGENTTSKALGYHALLGAAVKLDYASDVIFRNCRFNSCDATGLHISTFDYNMTVDGCDFTCLGGSGVAVGLIDENTGWSAAEKYDVPAELTNVGSVAKKTNATPANIRISDNYFGDVGFTFFGCNGIFAPAAHKIDIAYNTIENLDGTAIAVGWGWANTGNVRNSAVGSYNVVGNQIRETCRYATDAGGIYTLGFFLYDGCYVADNYIDMKHSIDPVVPAIYLDEGSQNVFVTNNVSLNSSLWLSERALPVVFDGQQYVITGMANNTMVDDIIDLNYSNKPNGIHMVGFTHVWPGAATVPGANFIVGEEIVVKDWKNDPAIMAIVNNAGCKR